jgi:hypothetical protein
MKKQTLAILILLITISYSGMAQLSVKGHAALSYIEHLSTGVTFSFSGQHHVSLLYGSNFFINTKDFSSYMFQYYLRLNRMTFAKITPVIGLKAGSSIYTDDYYKWRLVSVVPFMGTNYQLNKKIDVIFDLGAAISRVQSVKRIRQGEIGKYRELLPELKAGILYNF